MPSLEEKASGFLSSVRVMRKENTYKTYKRIVEDFLEFCAGRGVVGVRELDESLYYDYVASLGHLKHNTVVLYSVVVKKFYSFCGKKYNFMTKQQVETEVSYLTEEEVDRMISVRKEENEPLLAYVRKILLVSLLYSTGMRIGETVQLKVSNFNFSNNSITIEAKTAKRSKRRIVFFDDRTKNILVPYVKARKLKRGDRVIDVSKRQAENYIKEIAERAGIQKKVTPHVLRHSFAVNFLNKGGKIQILKKLMGHESIDTTMRYLKYTDEDLRQEYTRAMGK